ncbi:MAG TPA: DNA-directed DNA polymerase II small subunit [Candidatus Bilamarchaeaceae archaeon]|nr:DNA-directed DNA polymerase II small subunit [Candidatus Bilamarchaeaceae archaeon]
MFEKLIEKGIRITTDAKELLEKQTNSEELIDELCKKDKMFIQKEDIEELLKKEVKIQVARTTDFNPIAKEFERNIEVIEKRDVTGKSRTTGEVKDFVAHFRDRYSKIAKILHQLRTEYHTIDLSEVKKRIGEKARVIVIVNEKRDTKKGNMLLEIEDLTSNFKAVITTYDPKLFEKARNIINDDVIAISGKISEAFIIAEDIEWPDIPVVREKKLSENDLAIAYISDIHFGSRYFMEKYLNMFVDWLHGRGEVKELAEKVKYVIVGGDLVDGIGIYPNQEKELVVTDINKQYEMFNDFAQNLPEYIEAIIIPGNHDAVRRGEPMPAIGKDLITADVLNLGNPSTLKIEGIKHLLYHGTSLDSMIASIPNMSYMHPEKVMTEYLKRRHLSPIYGGNLIIPEKVDYMVIEEVPDVLHCGHVHKNGYKLYRETLIINSGTFQDQTEFQIKQGHVPTPGVVPIYELKTGRLRSLDFKI